ncbi:hypothetical protein FQA39_LY08539 [Lamprigera yunnana]|nr:hypothetical protein FQA39_LY08539 [Lamprigera yunnana]
MVSPIAGNVKFTRDATFNCVDHVRFYYSRSFGNRYGHLISLLVAAEYLEQNGLRDCLSQKFFIGIAGRSGSQEFLLAELLDKTGSSYSIAGILERPARRTLSPELKIVCVPPGKRKENERRPKSRKEKKRGNFRKTMGKNFKFQNARKKKAPLSSEDEDEEEWIESGNSLDDIVINEVTDQETDDIIFLVEDLKVGDYILALFVSTGKRAVVHYKYVAKILQVLEGDDFEVQCLKSLDETKTTFKFIENDQCVIAKKEILGRLPDPQLIQFGRILKTAFPAKVEVYE